jgi:hypothetical protein
MEGTTLHAIIAPSKKAEVVVKKPVAPVEAKVGETASVASALAPVQA